MVRIVVDPAQVRGSAVVLTGAEARRVARVLRKRAGDLLNFTDGRGRDFTARLESVGTARVEAVIVSEEGAGPAGLPVRLFQAVPKSQRMDWLVEKAVELGVSEIHPLRTARSVVKTEGPGGERLERWRRIAAQALGQSGGGRRAVIDPPCSLEEAIGRLRPGQATLVAWEGEKELSLKEALRTGVAPGREVNLFVGPEGGFTPSEISRLRAAGGRTVTLGPRTLRSETAPLVMLSALLLENEHLL